LVSSLQKSLERHLSEIISLSTYWSAPYRYQPRQALPTARMTTTGITPLDTLEAPARAGEAAVDVRVAWQGLTESLMHQITDPTKLTREALKEPDSRPSRRRTCRTTPKRATTT